MEREASDTHKPDTCQLKSFSYKGYNCLRAYVRLHKSVYTVCICFIKFSLTNSICVPLVSLRCPECGGHLREL